MVVRFMEEGRGGGGEGKGCPSILTLNAVGAEMAEAGVFSSGRKPNISST